MRVDFAEPTHAGSNARAGLYRVTRARRRLSLYADERILSAASPLVLSGAVVWRRCLVHGNNVIAGCDVRVLRLPHSAIFIVTLNPPSTLWIYAGSCTTAFALGQ